MSMWMRELADVLYKIKGGEKIFNNVGLPRYITMDVEIACDDDWNSRFDDVPEKFLQFFQEGCDRTRPFPVGGGWYRM